LVLSLYAPHPNPHDKGWVSKIEKIVTDNLKSLENVRFAKTKFFANIAVFPFR
jgi:hypothetical protein